MNLTDGYVIVLVTAPGKMVAQRIVKAALKEKLAACGNISAGIESHYWWHNKLEKSREVQITFKTTEELLPELERLVLEKHPYDTPEFVAINLMGGNGRYLDWIDENLR